MLSSTMTWTSSDYSHLQGEALWAALATDLRHLLSTEDHPITTLANAAAFVYHSLEQLNWAGFYLYDGKQLFLGPFAGKPACTTIAIGKGVCGTAAERKETVVVEDVDLFPGHIVCDGDSRSEIVVPLIASNGTLLGVLDIDSPIVGRFQPQDKIGIEQLAAIIIDILSEATLEL